MAERRDKDARDDNPRDPREETPRSRTDRGYDEAAHSGPSRYGDFEGRGGVFGTTGGGAYAEGFQTLEGPGGSPFDPTIRDRDEIYSRRGLPYSEVSFTESGPYSGKGPKGYERSDEMIMEDVNERLWRDGGIDAREITVQVEGGEVTLSGTVRNRAMKRMAADLAEDVTGVREVFNQVRIARDESRSGD